MQLGTTCKNFLIGQTKTQRTRTFSKKRFGKLVQITMKSGEMQLEEARDKKLSPKQLAAKIQTLENTMYTHAKNLEFEAAARVRDEIHKLNEYFVKT